MEFEHIPVMLMPAVDALDVKPDGIYADCTVGGGGHSFEIASRLSENGKLFCFDRDPEAVAASSRRLESFGKRVTLINRNFSEIGEALGEIKLDGALIDLGVSSYQLDNPDRGFSYMKDAPLDMRMNRGDGKSAFDVVNGYSREELVRILRCYGEEKFAPRIASYIVNAREKKPVKTTLELAEIVKKAIGAAASKDGGHPAKRTFQAIRIEVNGELEIIAPTLRTLADMLNPGGKISVITFHSLEDRIVKQTFAELAKGCVCPPKLPVCVCGRKPVLRPVRHAVLPDAEEIKRNPRSKSAKLRFAEKL